MKTSSVIVYTVFIWSNIWLIYMCVFGIAEYGAVLSVYYTYIMDRGTAK